MRIEIHPAAEKFQKGALVKLETFTGFRGKAATLEIQGVKFMVLARSSFGLAQICNYILKESGQTFSPDMIVPGIVIQSSVLPKPTKPKTTNEQTVDSSPKA